MKFRRVVFALNLFSISLFILGSIVLSFYEGDLAVGKDIVSLVVEFNLTSPLFYFSLGILSLMIIVLTYISLILYREIRERGYVVFFLGVMAFLVILSLFLNLLL